ncbi:MAG: GNAT family N-acetyltransferase [Nonlabens sp.]|uniref:GNAT family N-acetyltransferase n=1 Tax=Nonlabens sp. TaxID=1888209 RepID=UPI003EF2B12C
MEIIQATASHVEDLSKLFDSYRIFYKQPSDLKSCKDFLLKRIKGQESVIFIAIDSDQSIAGFTQLYPIFSSTRLKKAWLLNDLYVLKEHRGKGISKLLIEKAKELCLMTKARGIMLETEKSNTIGNQLYPSVGFKLCNDSTNYYEWNPS